LEKLPGEPEGALSFNPSRYEEARSDALADFWRAARLTAATLSTTAIEDLTAQLIVNVTETQRTIEGVHERCSDLADTMDALWEKARDSAYGSLSSGFVGDILGRKLPGGGAAAAYNREEGRPA